jgi:hypothetical protein
MIFVAFFRNFENASLKFPKNLKLFLDIDNVEIYNRAKFQFQIPYIRGSTKITKSDIF